MNREVMDDIDRCILMKEMVKWWQRLRNFP